MFGTEAAVLGVVARAKRSISGAGVRSSAEKVSTGAQSGTLPMIQIIWGESRVSLPAFWKAASISSWGDPKYNPGEYAWLARSIGSKRAKGIVESRYDARATGGLLLLVES